MSSPQRHTSSVLAIGATCAVGLVTYGLYIRHRNAASLHKTTCATLPQDLHHNASAKGSDVVNIYRQYISKIDIYVITGATSGLGREMALLLARAGANLILAVRNTQQGKRVRQEILQSQTSNATGTIHVWYLDLSSLDSVKAFVEKWKKTSAGPNHKNTQPRMRIAGLINNAGVYRVQGTTEDGFQTTWQVNAMAPALLTELLLPFMSPTARIVNVSSELHCLVYHVANNCPPTTNGASMYDYALSKACQVLHAHELTLRFHQKNDQRRAVAVEPGLVHTNIARHDSPLLKWFQYQVLGPFLLKSVDQGCATALYCLLSPDLEENKTQEYLFANCAPKSPTKYCSSLDEVYAQKSLFDQVWNT